LLLKVTGGPSAATDAVKLYTGSPLAEIAAIPININTAASVPPVSGTLDPGKSKFVAADPDASDFTLDQNAFSTSKRTLHLQLLRFTNSSSNNTPALAAFNGYTTEGYPLGAFTVAEYAGFNYDLNYSWGVGPEGIFTLNTNRDGFIQQPTVNGDIINVPVEIPLDYQSFRTGRVQLQAKIMRNSNSTVTTITQKINVVNTTAKITAVTYEDIDEMNGVDYSLDELLSFDNIITDKTMGDGVLRAEAVIGLWGGDSYVSLYYENAAGTTRQEVGRLLTNVAGSSIISFSGAPTDDPADIKIHVNNMGLTAGKTIQFAVRSFGSNKNIATKSIRILKP
jgi:hypothetical protein